MQIPIELVIVGIILIAFAVVIVNGTDYTIPMFVRTEFDNICNRNLAVIERDGGLSVSRRDTMRNELMNLGIQNISITAPLSGEWGSEVTLKVEGDYVFESLDYDSLSKESKTKHIVYENSTLMLCLD